LRSSSRRWRSPRPKRRWLDVVSARIAGALSSLNLTIENEINPLAKDAKHIRESPKRYELYDWKAWERLPNDYDKLAELRLLDLPDDLLKEASFVHGPHEEFLESLELLLNTCRVGPRYAYMVEADTFINRLRIFYATSFNYFERFEQLKDEYAELLKSINHSCWESIKFIEYVAEDSRIGDVRRKVYKFYSKIPAKYIDVLVFNDCVEIYVPRQLKGRVIGRQGATVQKLQQLLGRRVFIRENPSLTELYDEEHPDLPEDPETVELVTKVLEGIEELERRGITLRKLEKIMSNMKMLENIEKVKSSLLEKIVKGLEEMEKAEADEAETCEVGTEAETEAGGAGEW
jgi:hypothetical protein